jgi:hypothetical protein
MTKRSTFKARALGALAAALAIVAVSLVVAAPPASAEMRCNGDGDTFNACLHFEWLGYGWLEPHVGMDVYMPEQHARDILAYGANFKASLWGDDGGGSDDDFILPLSVAPSWPIADSTGMAVEFVGRGVNEALDEDDGVDELYARVSFRDPFTGVTREFRTGVIRGEY